MKKNVLLVFGGQSFEHNISILSFFNLYGYFNKKLYNIFILYIDLEGIWYLIKNNKPHKFNCLDDFKRSFKSNTLGCTPEISGNGIKIGNKKIDVIFPLLHGKIGEDGSFQGFCNVINTPCVGPTVTGACVGFDKEITKNMLIRNDLPVNKFIVINKENKIKNILKELRKRKINFPVFSKPSRSGSSLGVKKSMDVKELEINISNAFIYDDKVLIEEYINGIELEIYCYYKNHKVKTTIIGDVRYDNGFYDYEKKYLDGCYINNIPSVINAKLADKVASYAVKAFKCLDGRGIARFDFFLDYNKNLYINEINTIPGYIGLKENNTLIKESKIGYSKLIDILINETTKKKEVVHQLISIMH